MQKSFWICGKHTVLSAIHNPHRSILKIIIGKNFDANLVKSKKVELKDNFFFDKLFKNIDINHQHIAALISPLPELNLKQEITNIKNIIILDSINDPRNIGSIIRSAVAFGIDSIVIQKKYFNQTSLSMLKAASGAFEFIKIFSPANLNETIKQLKKNNFWVAGFDGAADKNIYEYAWSQKNAFVFGSEGSGLRNLIQNNCDKLLRIPISNKIGSLNVSNAVASVLSIYKSKIKHEDS